MTATPRERAFSEWVCPNGHLGLHWSGGMGCAEQVSIHNPKAAWPSRQRCNAKLRAPTELERAAYALGGTPALLALWDQPWRGNDQ